MAVRPRPEWQNCWLPRSFEICAGNRILGFSRLWSPIMLAVILAGGKGTRLKPFTMTIPKPLLPLGDMPILEVVLAQLADAKISRVALTLGHMSPLFRALLGNGERFGLSLEYCFEDEPLGTAGSIR